jgi:hypothetical protein
MYAIQSFEHAQPGSWFFSGFGWPAQLTDRAHARRFATLEDARAVFRTLPPAGRFLIVAAEEDRK